jgi:hypothetical protein
LEEEFLTNFAGLKEQYQVSKRSKVKVPNSGDTKFCSLLVMILLFVLTLVSVIEKRDVNISYWVANSVREIIEQDFEAVSNEGAMWDFYEKTLGPMLF